MLVVQSCKDMTYDEDNRQILEYGVHRYTQKLLLNTKWVSIII